METQLQCPVFRFDESASNIYHPLLDQIERMTGKKPGIYSLAAYDILQTTVLTSLAEDPDRGFASFKARFIQTAADYFGATGNTLLDANGDRKIFFTIFGQSGSTTKPISGNYRQNTIPTTIPS